MFMKGPTCAMGRSKAGSGLAASSSIKVVVLVECRGVTRNCWPTAGPSAGESVMGLAKSSNEESVICYFTDFSTRVKIRRFHAQYVQEAVGELKPPIVVIPLKCFRYAE